MMTSRPSAPASRSGLLRERVQRVGVEHQRNARPLDQRVHEAHGPRRRADPRTERDHVVRAFEQPVDDPSGEAAVGVSPSASVMYSGAMAATTAWHACRRRDRHEPGAGSQRAHAP